MVNKLYLQLFLTHALPYLTLASLPSLLPANLPKTPVYHFTPLVFGSLPPLHDPPLSSPPLPPAPTFFFFSNSQSPLNVCVWLL
ncbi:hypothetical protein BGX38DRAFT_629005 [Terfezia claveryi]|nr:hypothetical protein BGX38DRAFT_629005 [Terfezia claveryi]